ncbi:Hypothetical predicted protein [Paramuricea clavata]|uniref:Uncharacterized protein n=1 Tax=Paramuricea clavata TaxID=317549 RepID=A0A7D9DI63_PARCT|nr:Hypothetical predicted protein [Paramuricea clavata]
MDNQSHAISVSRLKSGHEKNKRGICLTCFGNGKKGKCSIAHFNPSSIERHKNTVHSGVQALIVRNDDLRARHAVKLLNENESLIKPVPPLPGKTSGEKDQEQLNRNEDSHDQTTEQDKEMSGESSKCLLDEDIWTIPPPLSSLIPLSEEDPLIDKEESLTSQPNTQSAVDKFFVSSKEIAQSSEPSIKELSGKLDKVLNLLSVSATNTEAVPKGSRGSSKAIPKKQILPRASLAILLQKYSEFLDLNKDIELVGDSEDKTWQQLVLSTPMPSTGLPPHFYITAEKSTNHRVTNQVSMVCPVVDGERKAIPLATRQVHKDSSGHGGLGDELAEKVFEDLDKHAKIDKDTPDHDNTEITEYKIAGTDFVYDLLGTIDLLWPLALLMIWGQLEWCPVWKFPSWIPLVEEQLRQVAKEVIKDGPAHSVCPHLHEH